MLQTILDELINFLLLFFPWKRRKEKSDD